MEMKTFRRNMYAEAEKRGLDVRFPKDKKNIFSITIEGKYHNPITMHKLLIFALSEKMSVKEKSFLIYFTEKLKEKTEMAAVLFVSTKTLYRRTLCKIHETEVRKLIGFDARNYPKNVHYYLTSESNIETVRQDLHSFQQELERFLADCEEAEKLVKFDSFSYKLTLLGESISIKLNETYTMRNEKSETIETDQLYNELMKYYRKNRMQSLYV